MMNFIEKIKEKKIFLTLILIISLIVGWIYVVLLAPKLYLSSSSMMILIKGSSEEQDAKSSGNLLLSDDVYRTIEEFIKSNNVFGKAVKNTNIKNSEIFVYKSPDSNIFKIQVNNYNQDSSIDLLKEVNNVFSTEIKNINESYEVYVVDEPKIVNETYNSKSIGYVLISLFVGILFDIVYVLVSMIGEKQYNTTKRGVEEEFSLKELARLPFKKITDPLDINEIISNDDDLVHMNRNLRKLRANIQFINVNNSDKKTFLITSPLRYEGKTFLTINLANSYAEIGKKVIIVDCDLNNGKLDKIFGLENTIGTSNFLSGLDNNGSDLNKKIKDYIICSNINGVDVIPSGIVPPNSSELLSSKNLQSMIKTLSREYDIVIIDGPETLKTADSLIITRVVGTTILVADVKYTKYEDLIQAKNDIQNVGGRIVGVVVNKIKTRTSYGEKRFLKSIASFFGNLFDKFSRYIERQKRIREKRLLEKAKIEEEKAERSDEEDYTQMSFMDSSEANKDELIESNYTIPEILKEDDDEEDEVEPEKSLYDVQDEVEEEVEEEVQEDVQKVEEVIEKAEPEVVEAVEEAIEEPEEVVEETPSRFSKEKLKTINRYIKNFEKNHNLVSTKKKGFGLISKVSKLFNDKKNKKEENQEASSVENESSYEEEREFNPNNILVIVDSENGYARAFNQECYTEKLIRGLDKGDGFLKAYYSPFYTSKRVETLMMTYGINKTQAKRIDPLIQAVLSDFDEKVWIYKKVASNIAEQYVQIMAKDYDKEENEKSSEYKKRCKEQRKKELRDNNIEIEYNLNILKSNSEITLIDRLVMNRYANILGDTTKKILNNSIDNILDASNYSKDDYEKRYDDEQYANMETESLNKLSENLEDINYSSDKKKIEQLEKNNIDEMNKIIDEKKTYKNEIDALRKKSRIERSAIDIQREIQEEKTLPKEPEYEENIYKTDIYSDSEDKKKIREENAMLRKEKRQEQQLLKKIKKEKKILKKEEERKRKELERQQRDSRKEEEKKIREFKKAQEREEARIEEELLENNLYPKTKNLKNL